MWYVTNRRELRGFERRVASSHTQDPLEAANHLQGIVSETTGINGTVGTSSSKEDRSR